MKLFVLWLALVGLLGSLLGIIAAKVDDCLDTAEEARKLINYFL